MYKDYVNKSLHGGDVEVRAISIAVQPEFDRLRAESSRNFARRWIKSADAEGVKGLEGERGVVADIERDTPDSRKERLLELNRRSEPFTEKWLNAELLRRTGSDAITAHVDGLTLTVCLKTPFGKEGEAFMNRRPVRELMPWLRGVIPCGVFLLLRQTAFMEPPCTPCRASAVSVFAEPSVPGRPAQDGNGAEKGDGFHIGTEVFE